MTKKKNILIISYYWPPAGGISPLRILKFTKYLRKFDWEPIVCIPKNADYIYRDPNNFKDIPENITIIETKIAEPFKLFKFLSGRKKNDTNNPFYGDNTQKKAIDNFAIWIRGNFFIPDARALWIKPTVKILSKFLKENKIDAILTDGPPHTNTMIAQKLAVNFNIPWLADFQDPWTQADYYEKFNLTKWADRKHKKMEQLVFQTAKKITIASPTWAKNLESIGAQNVDVIYYGYDEDDFVHLQERDTSEFIISHTGIIGEDRNPEIFFKVLSDLIKENTAFKSKLRIKFAGPVGETIREEIRKNKLQSYYSELGNISRDNALQLNKDSKILLLPINKADNAEGRLPGKLYEYIRISNPILCLGPEESDVARIINETKSGKTFSYNNYNGIKSFILEIFENKTKSVPVNVEQFSNENQTKILVKYLNEITKE